MPLGNRTIQDVTDYDAKELNVGDKLSNKVQEGQIRWDLLKEIGIGEDGIRDMEVDDYESLENRGALELSQRYEDEYKIGLKGMMDSKDLRPEQVEGYRRDMMSMYSGRLNKYSDIFGRISNGILGKTIESAKTMYSTEGE